MIFLQFSALFSAVIVVLVRSPVLAVLYLISLFVHAAAYLVLSSARYVGLVYVVVYVGAIAVLFVFVLILLDLAELEYSYTGYAQAIPLTGVVLVSFGFVVPTLSSPELQVRDSTEIWTQLQALIVYFYSYGALALLALSLILLLAMLGPIMLCKRRALIARCDTRLQICVIQVRILQGFIQELHFTKTPNH